MKRVLPVFVVIALRFFGLFVVLPVMVLHIKNLGGDEGILAGLAMSVYALTQVIFQVPFGVMSDKYGRIKVLIGGLLVFALGSAVCALADNVYVLIVGRALQGAGAIGAVCTALVADLVGEDERIKAMAMMGGFIAFSFVLSMLVGSYVGAFYSVGGLFWLTCGLSALGAFLVFAKRGSLGVGDANKSNIKINSGVQDLAKNLSADDTNISGAQNSANKNVYINVSKNAVNMQDVQAQKTVIRLLLQNKNLLNIGAINFLQKSFMMVFFTITPLLLVRKLGLDKGVLHSLYLSVVGCGVLAMGLCVLLSRRFGQKRLVLVLGFLAMVLGFWGLFSCDNINSLRLGMIAFFVGFNLHEPLLQSLASSFVPKANRGAALGIFNTFGFLGIFGASFLALHVVDLDFGFWILGFFGLLGIWFTCRLKI